MRAGFLAATAAAVLAGTSALAQQHPMPHPKPAAPARMQGMGGMQMGMDMMGGPSAAMILQHRQRLGLSAQQVQRLEALRAQDSAAAMPHMREAMAAHQAAAQLLRAEQPDFSAYEAKLHEAANHAILGHVAMARSNVEARRLLTADQRARLQTAMKSGGMMGGMGGMSGMMSGGGMMMDCPMMGMGGAQATPMAPKPAGKR